MASNGLNDVAELANTILSLTLILIVLIVTTNLLKLKLKSKLTFQIMDTTVKFLKYLAEPLL